MKKNNYFTFAILGDDENDVSEEDEAKLLGMLEDMLSSEWDSEHDYAVIGRLRAKGMSKLVFDKVFGSYHTIGVDVKGCDEHPLHIVNECKIVDQSKYASYIASRADVAILIKSTKQNIEIVNRMVGSKKKAFDMQAEFV
jgi:hypothetical protein